MTRRWPWLPGLARWTGVLLVLLATLGAVLWAHDQALSARAAQLTLARAQASVEREAAVGQLSTPAEALAARERSLAEIDGVLGQLHAQGVTTEATAGVRRALDAVVDGPDGGQQAVAFAELQSQLYLLDERLGAQAVSRGRAVRYGIVGVLVAASLMLLGGGARHAARSRRRAAARAEQQGRRRSEQRYRLLAQHATDVVCVVDPDTTVTYITPSIARLIGQRPEQRLGRPLLEVVADDDRDELLGYLSGTIEDGSSAPGERAGLRLRDDRGELVDTEVVAVNLLNEETVGGVALTIRDVRERRSFEQQLRTAAFYDPLTELPNRELLLDRAGLAIARADRQGIAAGIVVIDLDDFSALNDGAGRETGDAVLRAAAERIVSSMRDTDTAARVGGDEFAVLLDGVGGADEALEIADRLLEELRAPLTVDGAQLECRASAGVAVTTPGAAHDDADDGLLLAHAGAALRTAKSESGDRPRLYSAELAAQVRARLQLTTDLRNAAINDEFRLVYQPSVLLASGEPVTAEALIRWEHPERGWVNPGEFIELAERTGLIVPIGRWVLDTACAEAAGWTTTGPNGPPSISVNVSARQVERATLVDEVRSALATSGLEPGRLVLEITETALAGDVAEVVTRLRQLRELGVRLAIDDFGTGYSSLSYLQQLPIQILKIDKAFVDNVAGSPQDRALAATITDMARSLRLGTVAEGVEDHDQAAVLRDLGCDIGQGYLWSKPVPAADVRAFFAAATRSHTVGPFEELRRRTPAAATTPADTSPQQARTGVAAHPPGNPHSTHQGA